MTKVILWFTLYFFIVITYFFGVYFFSLDIVSFIGFELDKKVNLKDIPFLFVILFLFSYYFFFLGITFWLIFSKLLFSKKDIEDILFSLPLSKIELNFLSLILNGENSKK